MRARTVSVLRSCPTCVRGIVRAKSLSAREIAEGVPQDNLAVIGCCATSAQSAAATVYVPAATVAQWPAVTAEQALNAFCPDCGDTAEGCKYLQAEVDGLAELVDVALELSDTRLMS